MHSLEFPDVAGLAQNEEWCRVTIDGQVQQLRFHDYARIFNVPGLYEDLFYGRLKCTSPKTVAGLLQRALSEAKVDPKSLRGLDLGAGNGMVGEQLREVGVPYLVGADLIPEAASATKRDRPSVYADYVVADFTALSEAQLASLRAHRFNLFSCVAALGFGDIPSRAFVAAWELLESPAWVAFNIKADFLDPKYQYGFSLLVRRLLDTGLFTCAAQVNYVHRLGLDGTPLHYTALVGTRTGSIPMDWYAQLD